jgi:hypothetical protein
MVGEVKLNATNRLWQLAQEASASPTRLSKCIDKSGATCDRSWRWDDDQNKSRAVGLLRVRKPHASHAETVRPSLKVAMQKNRM